MVTAIVSVRTLELKRLYRKNMAIGFGISSFVHLAAVGTILLVAFLANRHRLEIPQIVIVDPVRPPTLSPPVQIPIHVKTVERVVPPAIGNIIAVPSEEAPEEIEIPTQKELQFGAGNPAVEELENVGVNVDVKSIIDKVAPPPDPAVFVPREVDPVKIVDVQPAYPHLAQRAGVEGVVWLNVLIDRDGTVKDVIIVKDSGANAGFEEAAVEAAYKTVWKPAIANGQPIAIWTTYRIKFRLRN